MRCRASPGLGRRGLRGGDGADEHAARREEQHVVQVGVEIGRRDRLHPRFAGAPAVRTLVVEFGVEAVDVALDELGELGRLVGETLVGGVVQGEVSIGEIAVDVRVVLAGSEPLRPLAAHLDDLFDERAGAVLGECVPLAEAEAAPVVGDDVGHAVLGAGDRRDVPGELGRGGRRGLHGRWLGGRGHVGERGRRCRIGRVVVAAARGEHQRGHHRDGREGPATAARVMLLVSSHRVRPPRVRCCPGRVPGPVQR